MSNEDTLNLKVRPHHLENFRSPDLIREFSEISIEAIGDNLDSQDNDDLLSNCQNFAPKASEHWLGIYIRDTLLNDWPREHGMFLLVQSAELARIHWLIHRHQGETLEVNLFDKQFQVETCIERRDLDNSEDRLTAWLTNISVAILCNDQAAQQEMFKVEHKDLCQSFEGQPIRDIELAFFDLFHAFLLGESDKQRQIQLMKAVIPILTDEILIEACDGNEYWQDFYQWLRFPLYSIISVCWGYEDTSLDKAVIASIDANYEYYSEIEPRQNGGKTGKESLDLLADEAMFHTITTAFLTAHYRRTGQTVSFDSPYIPQWLIKGEGPTREEVLANPPVFDLEHVLGNQ